MVFRWFASSSPTVPKAPTAISITVSLTFHNFFTYNLKFWHLVIFSSYFNLVFWSPWIALQERRWFLIICSLYQWLQYIAFCVLFPYQLGLQSPNVFCICYFPALVVSRTICLHIQSQSTCTDDRVVFFQVCSVSSYIDFQLAQNTNCQYRWHSQLSLHWACLAGTRPSDKWHLFWVIFLEQLI